MEVTKKMTSDGDIILKSWLRTLRYSTESYEDTFESGNNCGENNRRAKNMVIGGDSSEESDDEQYVNIWDCSHSKKGVPKFKHSLESVENASEVSTNLEGEHSSLITGTYSSDYSVEGAVKVTDLDDENIKIRKIRKKPVATPRRSKSSENCESIYQNLPVKICNTSADLPVFAEQIIDEPIYQNLPLINPNRPQLSKESVQFEEEVSSTIRYLEDVIESVAPYSDDSDSDNFESPENSSIYYSSIDSKVEDDICSSVDTVEEEKFTISSSSSFSKFLNKEQLLKLIGRKDIELGPHELSQRFAKDNRVSAFFEESEPGLPQEIKSIPLPKRNTNINKRFSVPLSVLEKIHVAHKSHSFKENLEVNPKGGGEELSLNYAKESRVSYVFDEEVLEEWQIFDALSENLVYEEDRLLKRDIVCWMASLMDEDCGELENIMEEKELLKSINQVPKDRAEKPLENKFPLVEDVELRAKPEIRKNRLSKTTDFDAGRRRQTSAIPQRNFEIRGIVTIKSEWGKPILVKLNEEYILYENENLYRVKKNIKSKELLASNVIIKSLKYQKSKESKQVELRDDKGEVYTLHFQELKYAKQFMENEKVQIYIHDDNKVTIKKTLLRFLGKRSSREILEKKGIYKNEPIFGNTLKDIYTKSGTNSMVPAFIYEVIKLLEMPENITSLGVYRTSGNLATIQKIRFEVDNGRLSILSQYAKDPDVLTGSLKLFFRELKEPLVSRDVCEKILDFAKLDPKQFSSKEHQKIRSILVKSLHEANLETFSVIMRHLLEVVKYKEHNKMDAYNLAVCWGPSIVFSVQNDLNLTAELSRDIVTQSQNATRFVDFLLVYYDLYPAELATLGKRQRPESIPEKLQSLMRQDSRDSVGSHDSSKSQKKSASSLSLSVDEITKKLVEFIDPYVTCEGLYRRAGTADKTSKIMKKLNKKKISELEKYKHEVHDLTDALKKYLKEQDCLVSDETVEMVLRTSPDSSYSCLEPATRRKLVSLIEDTPKKDTFIFLLRHLAKVLEYQEQNYNVPKNEFIAIWTAVLNNQKKSKMSNEDFAKFLAIAVKVFNDNLPDVVRSSFPNNGSSPKRNESMDELLKEMKNQHRQAEKDRNSRYDNVDSDVGEASILDDKTEQTKL